MEVWSPPRGTSSSGGMSHPFIGGVASACSPVAAPRTAARPSSGRGLWALGAAGPFLSSPGSPSPSMSIFISAADVEPYASNRAEWTRRRLVARGASVKHHAEGAE
jgi:hypothetical protein